MSWVQRDLSCFGVDPILIVVRVVWYSIGEASVRITHRTGTDRILRMAALTYLVPRAAIGLLILAMFGLGAFLVLIRFAIVMLQRLGA